MRRPRTTAATGDRLSPLAIMRAVLAAYRLHWALLFGSAFVVFGLVNLIEWLLPEVEADHLEARGLAAGLLVAGISVLTHAFAEAFYEGVMAAAAVGWRTGHSPPGLWALARTIPYVPLILVNVVIAVATTVGLFALIVPGVLAGTYLALAPALVKIEHHETRAALGRSVELVRGHVRPVMLIVWGAYLGTLGASQAVEAALDHAVGEYLAVTIVEAAFAPFYGLAIVLVAFDLLERERVAARR